jgi:hypothetical protein
MSRHPVEALQMGLVWLALFLTLNHGLHNVTLSNRSILFLDLVSVMLARGLTAVSALVS